MKTKLLYLMLLICSYSYTQTRIVSGLGGARGVQVIGNYVYTANGNDFYRAPKNQTTTTPQLVATGFHNLINGYNLANHNGTVYIPGGGASGIYATYVLGTLPQTASQYHTTSGSVSCAFVYNNEVYFTGTNPSNNSQHELRKVTGTTSVFVASLPVGHQYIADITNDGSTFYLTFTGTGSNNGTIYSVDVSAINPTLQVVKIGLPSPWGIHFVDDYLYFTSNQGTGYIRKIHKSGTGAVGYVGQALPNPRGFDIDGQDIYVACTGTNPGIYKYTDPYLPANCVAPTNITVSTSSNNTATISWHTAPNATSYDVTYVLAGDNINSGTTIASISGLSTTISGLTYGAEYDVYVKSNCASFPNNPHSGYSNYVRFKNGITYVDASAIGNNDGTSWTDAYTDLQTALNTASSSDKIWVAKGTYTPSTTGNRDESFIVLANVYGGFAGNETDLSDRDMSLIHTTNATILTGDLSNNDAAVAFNDATRIDNSKHVVEVTANNVELNGLTIANGHANATSGNDRFGAGVFKSISVTNFTIKNCVVKNNVALSGAGLSLTSNDTSNIVIDACIFENNLANVGAGIDYHLSGSSKTIGISITNSLFNANKTADNATLSRVGTGGSAARLRAYFSGVVLNTNIVNNTFVNNDSQGTSNANSGNFPVITLSHNSGKLGNITIANNIFWGNTENGGQVAKSIGKSSDSADQFNNTNNVGTTGTLVVVNNTDQDGFSTFPSTPTGTYVTNPNLNPNFQLPTGSYAIDTGDNTVVSTTTDLLGNQRIFNTTVDRGAFEFGSSILGLNDFNQKGLEVLLYPNPVNSFIQLKTKENIKKAEVFTILGAKVKTLNLNNNNVNVKSLSSGIYFLKIIADNGKISIKKFLKK